MTRNLELDSALALTRRGTLAAGLSVAFATQARARDTAQAKRKLVYVMLRGGMDGMMAVPPLMDPAYVELRGALAIPADRCLPLDGDFGLHPALTAFQTLAAKGEARVAPAIAVPAGQPNHRNAQDSLESGHATLFGSDSGWLGRTLEVMAGSPKGLAVGTQRTKSSLIPLVMRGDVQTSFWAPKLSPTEPMSMSLTNRLAHLYRDDPLFSAALSAGLDNRAKIERAEAASRGVAIRNGEDEPKGDERASAVVMGRTIAGFMREDGGPQIVTVNLDGWDTHGSQGNVEGAFAYRLTELDGLIEGLSGGMGSDWNDTMIVVVTEFGRMIRINEKNGCHHGNAFASLVMGGGLKKGGIIGDWPGLADGKSVRGALASTMDVRSLFKGVLRDHLGVDMRSLESTIFPDSAAQPPVANLV